MAELFVIAISLPQFEQYIAPLIRIISINNINIILNISIVKLKYLIYDTIFVC